MTSSQKCSSCETVNPADARFCTQCRQRLIPNVSTKSELPDPLLGRTIDGRFRIVSRIGRGGMATVYCAEQLSIGRFVAFKVLNSRYCADPKLRQRFRNEAALASRLNHPNSVTIYDFGETDDGAFYIAMELIEGVTLSYEIKKRKIIPWKRAARIASQIGASLNFAHDRSIIHRDLKPDNIMLTRECTGQDFIKVLDFGIAKALDDNATERGEDLTSRNEVFGTPEYMSPEQVAGKPLDHRTDIYSFGILLYRMLTGAMPFEAETPMLMMVNHLSEPPRPFYHVNLNLRLPPKLEELVMSTLFKRPAARPQSMQEIVLRLSEILQDGTRGFAGWTPSCGIPIGRIGRRPSSVFPPDVVPARSESRLPDSAVQPRIQVKSGSDDPEA